jgi:hypothetical protein
VTRCCPVDVLFDPGDTVEVTHSLLARNDPQRGLVVIHPAADSQNPIHDLFDALGVSARDLNIDRISGHAASWNAAAAWARTSRVSRIVLLRAHLLAPGVWPELRALAEHLDASVLLVFHQYEMSRWWQVALQPHPVRTFNSLQEVTAAYRWLPPRGPGRQPPQPLVWPPLPAQLPASPVLRWRAEAHRDLDPANFERVDTLYRHGFSTACAWLAEHPHFDAGTDTDERVQALLVQLVHDCPTPRHTLTLLRGAEAGFLAHGHHLSVPDLDGLGGPGLTSAILTAELAARIRAGTGSPLLAAGIGLAMVTGLAPRDLAGFPVDDPSGSSHRVRLPLPYVLSPHDPRAEPGCHDESRLQQPGSTAAMFYLPLAARPLVRAARLCVHGAGRSVPHWRLFGADKTALTGRIRAAADRCGITLPGEGVGVQMLWQLRVRWTRLGVSAHDFEHGAGCPPPCPPVPAGSRQPAPRLAGDVLGARWSPGASSAGCGRVLDDVSVADAMLRLARVHAGGSPPVLPPIPAATPIPVAVLARELVERHVAVRVTDPQGPTATLGFDLHPDLLFALQLTDRPGPAHPMDSTEGSTVYTVLRKPGDRPDRPTFATLRPALRRRPLLELEEPLRPFTGETWRSYHRRLENANSLKPGSLNLHAGYIRNAPLPVVVYSTLTGLPHNTLLHALPELAALTGSRHVLLTDHMGAPLQRHLLQRYACRLCTAKKGITGESVTVLTLDDRNVCARHARWVGARIDAGQQQPDISGLREMFTARIRHRNLARRYGRTRIQKHFNEATAIVRSWALHGYWAHARQDRMQHLGGRRLIQISPGNPLLDAVIYPEVVGLTSIIASAYWRDFFVHRVFWDRADPAPLYAEIDHRLGITGYQFEVSADPLVRYLENLASAASRARALPGGFRTG